MTHTAACYGIACPSRAQCARYHAAEGVEVSRAMASCETWDHRYPAFELIPVRGFVAPVAVTESEGGACD